MEQEKDTSIEQKTERKHKKKTKKDQVSSHVWNQILQYALLTVCQQQWPRSFVFSSQSVVLQEMLSKGKQYWDKWQDIRYQHMCQIIESRKGNPKDPVVLAACCINMELIGYDGHKLHHKIKMIPNDAWILFPQTLVPHPCLQHMIQSWRTQGRADLTTHSSGPVFEVTEDEWNQMEHLILFSNVQWLLMYLIQDELAPYSDQDVFGDFCRGDQTHLNSILKAIRKQTDVCLLKKTIPSSLV